MLKPFYFLAALSFLFMNSYADTSNTSSATCPSSSDCGNGLSIRYPFWVVDNSSNATHQFCGYPDFGLTCSHDGQPILTLPTDTYYVTNINYDSYTLTLVDIDVLNQKCPRARHNVTLGTLPLYYSRLDLNLTFYFNCSSYPSLFVPSNTIECFNSSGIMKQSYVFVEGNETDGYDWSSRCEEKVVVVVKEDEIDIDGLASGFGVAMNKGFVLDWGTAMACAHCEDSDGYCGYNQTSKQMLCFCKDGTIATQRCNQGMMLGFLEQLLTI